MFGILYMMLSLCLIVIGTVPLVMINAFVVTDRIPHNAFQRQSTGSTTTTTTSKFAFVVPMMDVPVSTDVTTSSNTIQLQYQQHSSMNTGIRSYLSNSITDSSSTTSTTSSSSLLVSLQDRKIPTKEEIDQKKFTFNVIFWGGGFVAPFIATIFYFGFRFWEK